MRCGFLLSSKFILRLFFKSSFDATVSQSVKLNPDVGLDTGAFYASGTTKTKSNKKNSRLTYCRLTRDVTRQIA